MLEVRRVVERLNGSFSVGERFLTLRRLRMFQICDADGRMSLRVELWVEVHARPPPTPRHLAPAVRRHAHPSPLENEQAQTHTQEVAPPQFEFTFVTAHVKRSAALMRTGQGAGLLLYDASTSSQLQQHIVRQRWVGGEVPSPTAPMAANIGLFGECSTLEPLYRQMRDALLTTVVGLSHWPTHTDVVEIFGISHYHLPAGGEYMYMRDLPRRLLRAHSPRSAATEADRPKRQRTCGRTPAEEQPDRSA